MKRSFKFSKEVEKNPSLLGEELNPTEYWKSVEDIQAKYTILQLLCV